MVGTYKCASLHWGELQSRRLPYSQSSITVRYESVESEVDHKGLGSYLGQGTSLGCSEVKTNLQHSCPGSLATPSLSDVWVWHFNAV